MNYPLYYLAEGSIYINVRIVSWHNDHQFCEVRPYGRRETVHDVDPTTFYSTDFDEAVEESQARYAIVKDKIESEGVAFSSAVNNRMYQQSTLEGFKKSTSYAHWHMVE